MNKWTTHEEIKLKELAASGITPTEASCILNRTIAQVAKRYKKFGVQSQKQKLITEQLELKKIGLRRCSVCKDKISVDSFRKTFNTEVRARTCRACERIQSNARHRQKILTFTLSDAIHHKVYQAKRRDTNSQLTYDIVLAQWNNQNGQCFYTGNQMTTLPNDKYYFSIDRSDSSLGYTADNIVLCCNRINIMKLDSSKEEFILWCKQVVAYAASLKLENKTLAIPS